jgi:hypothetical protein
MRTSRSLAIALGVIASLALAAGGASAQETDVKLGDEASPAPRQAEPRAQPAPRGRTAAPQARPAPRQQPRQPSVQPEAGFRGVRTFIVTDTLTQGFGQARERAARPFALTDKMYFYAEPVGFGFTPAGSSDRFRAQINFEILDADGQVVAKGQNPAGFNTDVPRNLVPRFFLTYTFDLTGIQPGDFQIRLTLTDEATGRQVVKAFPFQVRRGETS